MDETQRFHAKDAIRGLDILISNMPPGSAYYQEPLPSGVDEQVGALCRGFARAPNSERAAFSGSLTRRHGDFLLVFSERMASLGIRESSLSRVRDGLTAIAMLGPRTIDFREGLLVLSLHRHSAARLKADSAALLRDVAKVATSQVAEQLERLAHQEPAPIESMGFREVQSAEGFLYKRIW